MRCSGRSGAPVPVGAAVPAPGLALAALAAACAAPNTQASQPFSHLHIGSASQRPAAVRGGQERFARSDSNRMHAKCTVQGWLAMHFNMFMGWLCPSPCLVSACADPGQLFKHAKACIMVARLSRSRLVASSLSRSKYTLGR